MRPVGMPISVAVRCANIRRNASGSRVAVWNPPFSIGLFSMLQGNTGARSAIASALSSGVRGKPRESGGNRPLRVDWWCKWGSWELWMFVPPSRQDR